MQEYLKDIWMLSTQCVFWADAQEVSDLSLKARQCHLVDGVLCDHKLILQRCSQFTQIHLSFQAEIQSLYSHTRKKVLLEST